VLCDGDEDRYRLALPPGEGLSAQLLHTPAPGADASLEVVRVGALVERLGSSNDRWGLERVTVAPSDEDRELEVIVRGSAGGHLEYSLTLDTGAMADCPPDPGEGLFGNNDAAHPQPLGLDGWTGTLCPGDEDWLSLSLPAGCDLDVRVTAEGPVASVAAELQGPGGAPLVAGQADGDAVVLHAAVEAGGAHLLRLQGPELVRPLPIAVELTVAPGHDSEQQACQTVAELTAGGALALPDQIPVARFALSCGGGLTGDHVLAFDVDQPSVATLRAPGAQALGVRAACSDPGAELACDAGELPALERLPLAPGRYYAVVKVQPPLTATLVLELTERCDEDQDCGVGQVCTGEVCQPACDGDDDCAGGQRCDLPSGRCVEPERCAADEDCVGLRACRYDGVCFVAQCEESAQCAGVCVDRSCADSAPAGCAFDQDCVPGQRCVEGTCLLDGPCDGDERCPAGEPLCLLPAARCVGCRSDDDCLASEACYDDRCLYLGFCGGDEDCPGDRICADHGQCAVALPCPGDRFDGLAEPPELQGRVYDGLVLCDGYSDAYLATARATGGLRIVLRHDPAAGDLALTVYDGGDPLAIVGTSDGRSGVEIVGVPPQPEARGVEIAVTGQPGAVVPYSLGVERTGPEYCAPDGLEGLLGNNDAAHATRAQATRYDHRLCPGDEDWLAFDLAAGASLDIVTRTVNGGPQPSLRGYEPGGDLLGEGVQAGDALALSFDASSPGVHLVRLSGPADAGARALETTAEISVAPDAEALACAHTSRLVIDETLVFARRLDTTRFALSCGVEPGVQGADHLAAFQLDAPARVRIELEGGSTLALRAACDAAASELACSSEQEPVLELDLDAGEWFVVAHGYAAIGPSLTLTVVR